MIKSDLSVAGRDADLLIIRLELLLNLRCSYLAACLSQKILTGKCTARTTIGPGSDQVLGGDLVKTDNTCDCVDYTAVLVALSTLPMLPQLVAMRQTIANNPILVFFIFNILW